MDFDLVQTSGLYIPAHYLILPNIVLVLKMVTSNSSYERSDLATECPLSPNSKACGSYYRTCYGWNTNKKIFKCLYNMSSVCLISIFFYILKAFKTLYI